MTASSVRKSFLRQAMTENIGLKLLALAASIGLFVIVRGTEDAQISVAVDVVALLPPPSIPRMLVSEIPDEVRVTLRGSRSVLNSVRREGLTPIQMDLSDASAHFFYFDQEEFELPAGASIAQIAPSAVPLRWVDRSDGRVRVSPLLEGAVAPGHVLESTTVEPSSVRVRGMAAEVDRLTEVRTAAADVSGLAAGTHELRVPLGSLPEHVSYVDTVSVLVTVTIEEERGTRVFADLEVAVVGAANATVRPPQINVTVSGPRARVAELSPQRMVPYVDVSQLEPARGARPLEVQLQGVPEDIAAAPEPSIVLVTIPTR